MKIEPAVASDLVYVDSLQRKNAEELAFYPRAAFEREIEARRIVLARLNGEPAGYLYHGALAPICKIHQACIQYDLRGQLYGAALVNWLVAMARPAGVLAITLRCGSDIEANAFWARMGFECEAILPGGVRRRRDINCWRLPLTEPLFAGVQVVPSALKQDASLWRRQKGETRSQFMRGRQMRQYRALLEAADDAE